MKKILVPIKRVPDYQVAVKILADKSGVNTDGVKWVINPFDEIAVEEALRLKEAKGDIEVVVVSAGPSSTSEQIRTALAMGADRGILVRTDEPLDSDAAARILVALTKKESYDLIILGKQAVDSDANQTGQLLASALDLPQATFASKLVVDEAWKSALVTREVDGGLETIRVTLPAVITTDLRLNEPRYPSLPGIVKAKKKPLDEVPFTELGVDATPKLRVIRLEAPEKRASGVKVATVQELVAKLKNEAKVI